MTDLTKPEFSEFVMPIIKQSFSKLDLRELFSKEDLRTFKRMLDAPPQDENDDFILDGAL